MTVWDELAANGATPNPANALGARIADDLRAMVRAYDAAADRSQQRDLGPSEIGNPCTRCLARKVLGMGVARDFDDPWCAILGTAGHAWLDEAAAYANALSLTDLDQGPARWHPERRVHPNPDLLPKGGKADLYDEATHTVIDHKIVGAEQLRKYKLNGPGETYRIQAHLYGLGYRRAGEPVQNVAVAFWCRGGRLADLYVWTEEYEPLVAIDALKRYRVIRDQARAIGPALLPLLPAHPTCWDCGGKDVDPDELQRLIQQYAATSHDPATTNAA